MKKIILISDSTGDLGERVIRALTSQFPKNTFDLRVYRFIGLDLELEKIFNDIAPLSPIVFHTTLLKQLKKQITAMAKRLKIPAHDITGNAMSFLEKASGLKSKSDPHSLHELGEEYDRRIEALNYTIEHDDGSNENTWDKADIILCGISRTSKTPTSIYLADRGFKVANVPIIKNLPISKKLYRKPSLPIIGLEISADRLREIRVRRAQEERIPSAGYTDQETIDAEIRMAKNLFLELGCPIIDVTHRATEEVAALIQKNLSLKR